MNIKFDTESGAAYWKLSETPVNKTVKVSEHVVCDLDEAGNLCGLEFLNYSSKDWESIAKSITLKQV